MVPSAIWRIKSLHKSRFLPLQIEKWCSNFHFSSLEINKTLKACLKFDETMALLYSIMSFLQELESYSK